MTDWGKEVRNLQNHPFSWLNFGPMALSSLATLAMTSCQLADPAKLEQAKKQEEVSQLYPQPVTADLTPEAKEINDAARLLAGLPALTGQDANKQWRSENFWRAHKTGMEKMWNDFFLKK